MCGWKGRKILKLERKMKNEKSATKADDKKKRGKMP